MINPVGAGLACAGTAGTGVPAPRRRGTFVGADGVCPSQAAKAATRVAPTIGTDIMTTIHLRPGVPENDFGDIVALISSQEDVAISESSLLAIDLANNLI